MSGGSGFVLHRIICMFQQGSRPKSESSVFYLLSFSLVSVFECFTVDALFLASAAFSASLMALSLGFSMARGI